MKLKSLLFGSAAVLAAGTGAQAADLPVAEPVEYVRICDAFGAGYYYIPGSDTCLKIGGRVFAESNYVDGDDFVTPLGAGDFDFFGGGGQQDIDLDPGLGNLIFRPANGTFPTAYTDEEREFNNWTSRVRANIRLTAKTQTDFGLITTFVSAEANLGNNDFGTSAGGGQYSLNAAYIEIANDWGTYTAGRRGSFFNFTGGLPFNSRGVGVDASDDDKNLFAWTFAGGNGISASVAIEDPLTGHNRQDSSVAFATFSGPLADAILVGGVPLSAIPFGSAPGFDNYEGQEAPDLVGNIRIDQGWGSAMVMGAVRHLHDVERFEEGFPGGFLPLEPVGGTDEAADADGIGYAVGVGLGLNLPFWGLRSETQAGYSEGAIRYVTGDPIQNNFFGGITTGDFLGPDADGDSLTEAWSVRSLLSGDFTPTVGWTIGGSYTEVDSAEQSFALLGGGALDLNFEGIDYNHFGGGVALLYEPVSGLTFGWELAGAQLEIENSFNQRLALSNFTTAEDDFQMYRSTFRVNSEF